MSYPSREAAEAWLQSQGFTRRVSDSHLDANALCGDPSASRDYWAKRGWTHGWTPYETVELARIHEYRVDPEYGGGSHFDIRFF